MRSRWLLHWAKAARMVGLLRLLDRRLEVQDARAHAGAAHLLGQVVGVDHRAIHHRYESVDAVPQLADVPRPRVITQDAHRRPGDLLGLAALPCQARSRKCWTRSGDIVPPLAQGGESEGDHVEAVVQVLAKLALGQELVDVAVRRRDQPDVERISAWPPSRRTSRCSRTRSRSTWVLAAISPTSSRNSVPPCAISNQPGFWRSRAAERPLLVAEHLALDERLGERPDVGGDEGSVTRPLRLWRARAIDLLRSGNRITFRFAERSGITDYNVIWQPSLLVMDVGP